MNTSDNENNFLSFVYENYYLVVYNLNKAIEITLR
jgi:hypothetical protein